MNQILCQFPASHQLQLVSLSILLFAICCHSIEPTNEDNAIATATQSPAQSVATTKLSWSCNLQVDVPDIVRQSLVDEDDDEADIVHIVYANLKFDNVDLDPKTGYLSNTTHYITPLRWTLASGRRGDVLLGFPAIFTPLSLWTLALDVLYADVTVKTDACPDFLDASDSSKQEVLAKALYESVNSSSIGLPDFKVCQEIAHIPSALLGPTWVALLFNIYFVIYNTRHECWYEGDRENLSQRVYSPPAWFLPPTLALGIVGAVVFPLVVIRFIQRNNSPFIKEVAKKNEQGNRVGTGKVKRYYNRRTTIPVGLKYMLCYYLTPCAVFVRFILVCIFLFIILCPEVFFPLDSTYRLRVNAYYRNDFLRIPYYGYFIARAFIVLVPVLWLLPSLPMLCRSAHKWRRFKLADLPSGIKPYHAESRLERSYFGLFPFPDVQSYIPRPPQSASGLSCLYLFMLSRIQTALELHVLYGCFAQSMKRVWNGVLVMMWPENTNSIGNIMSAIACVVTLVTLLPLVAPFHFIVLCFSALMYLLPSAYILLCVTNTHSVIISFTHQVYHSIIWKWLGGQSDDDETSSENRVAMETDDEANSGNVAVDIEPKQSVVTFIKGAEDSGKAYIERVFRPDGSVRRGCQKFWPLPRFYAKMYKLVMGAEQEVAEEEGRSRSATVCRKILFVLLAALYGIVQLVAFLSIVLLVICIVGAIVILLSSVFIVYFFRIIALCTLFGSVLLLSYTGLVANTFAVMPYAVLGLSLFGFVVSSVTAIYDTYYSLLKTVIEMATKSRPDLCFVLIKKDKDENVEDEVEEYDEEEEEEVEEVEEVEVGEKAFEEGEEGEKEALLSEEKEEEGEKKAELSEEKEEGEKEAQASVEKEEEGGKEAQVSVEKEEGQKEAKLSENIPKKNVMKLVAVSTLQGDSDSEVMIDERLFWHVVEKCLPLRVQVMSRTVQVIIAILAVAVGVMVLLDIGELQDFSHFGVTLCILVITLVITHVRALIAVSAQEEKDDLEWDVKNAVRGFDAENKKKIK